MDMSLCLWSLLLLCIVKKTLPDKDKLIILIIF